MKILDVFRTSKFVDEILQDIKDNPESWKDYEGIGIKKNNVRISVFGNGRFLSLIDVYIAGVEIPSTYVDKYRLEVAVAKWYRTMSLKTISAC